MFVLRPVLFSKRGGSRWALTSRYKTDRADFTDWMYVLPHKLMEEINHNTEALSTNT